MKCLLFLSYAVLFYVVNGYVCLSSVAERTHIRRYLDQEHSLLPRTGGTDEARTQVQKNIEMYQHMIRDKQLLLKHATSPKQGWNLKGEIKIYQALLQRAKVHLESPDHKSKTGPERDKRLTASTSRESSDEIVPLPNSKYNRLTLGSKSTYNEETRTPKKLQTFDIESQKTQASKKSCGSVQNMCKLMSNAIKKTPPAAVTTLVALGSTIGTVCIGKENPGSFAGACGICGALWCVSIKEWFDLVEVRRKTKPVRRDGGGELDGLLGSGDEGFF